MTAKMTGAWMAVLAAVMFCVPAGAAEKASLETQQDRISYGIGVGVARNLKSQEIQVDLDAVMQGMKDTLSGRKLLMTETDLQKTMTDFQAGLTQKQLQARQLEAEKNKKEGEAYLAANAAKEGVVTLPSGLKYRIIKAGEGRTPTDKDQVECHYRGYLIDGTEFDSSYQRGTPATFKVNGVIPGWTEALKLMPAGSKWRLFIPPQLAYGAAGAGRTIGPNATLVFEVQLLAVK